MASEQPSKTAREVLPKSKFPVPTQQTPVYPPKVPHPAVPVPVTPPKKSRPQLLYDLPPGDPDWKDRYMVDGKLTTPYDHSDEPIDRVLSPIHPSWWPGWEALIKANPDIPDRVQKRREYRQKTRKPAKVGDSSKGRFSPYPFRGSMQDNN